METENKFITPGSDEAIELGCTCPVVANMGIGEFYWLAVDCPIHAEAAQEKHEVSREHEE